MAKQNVHACALVIGRTGLLIVGPSGAGKSLLAWTLVENARNAGGFAMLVADDRVLLSAAGGRLVAEAPTGIAGLLELRGYGPAAVPFEPRAVIDRSVWLVEPNEAPRVMDLSFDTLCDIAVPSLRLPIRQTSASAAAIAAWLELPGPEPL